MLTFDSALTNALKNSNTTAFWVLKLYYNDESAFIGVSDRHRHDGSDIYYGLVASWGTHRQTLDFFNFTTSIGNMSVTLINTDKSIQGKRFSDLLADNNFANRKWELFLNTNETSTLDTAARMIASGVISGEINYDNNNTTLTLFDNTTRFHKKIPANTVSSSTYPNAGSNNTGKPIPMAFGDFSVDSNAPTSTTEFDRHFTKGKFPAIISDEWDAANARVEALVDQQTIHTLNNKNIYGYKSGLYFPVDDANATESETGPANVSYRGNVWYVYLPLKPDFTYESGNYENEFDGDFTTTGSLLTATSGNLVSRGYRIPKISKLGTYTSINFMIRFNYQKTTPNPGLYVSNNAGDRDLAVTWDGTDQLVNISGLYSPDQTTNWDFESEIYFDLSHTAGSGTTEFSVNQLGVEIGFIPTTDKTYTQEIQETYEKTIPGGMGGYAVRTQFDRESEGGEYAETTTILSRTITKLTPSITDYIYCSGKGRKYGAWIDTVNSGTRNSQNGSANDPGYAQNDLIENPVYMIEDILRTELSLDSSTTGADIDITSFDYSGNTTNGYLGDIYEDAVGDVKFAFSQYKFINSKDMIERLGRLCFSYVFIGGDRKFKIKTLRRTDDYSSADQTVDFYDIDLGKVGKTSLGTVKNSILIKYDHDYGAKQNKAEATATDSTSAGTTVSGFNQTMKLEMDANEILDSTTASALASAYLEIMKDRHDTVNFSCVRPKYNHLEIGDIINFSNWPEDLKIYGQTMGGSWDSTTDTFSSVTTTWDNMAAGYFIVQDISKTVTGCSIKAVKVS